MQSELSCSGTSIVEKLQISNGGLSLFLSKNKENHDKV